MNSEPRPRPPKDLPATSDTLAEEAAAWFAKLRGGQISAAERGRFEAWRRADPAHGRAYAEIEAFWDGEAFAQILAEAAANPPAATARKEWRRLAGPGLALAAGLALFALLHPAGLGCWQADYCTAVGEVKTLTLADGSRVTLDTDSALSVELGGSPRHASLRRGAALFEVSHDPRRPFLAEGRYSQIRVKGTRFALREEAASDIVSVLSGVVEASRGGRSPVLLRGGEQVSVDADRPGAVRQTAGTATAWAQGRLLFDDAPLAEVVAEIARYRHGAVLIKSESLKSLRVSGRFDLADTGKALESLAQTLPIRVYRITPWLVVIA